MAGTRSETREETFEVDERVRVELRSLPSGHAAFLPGEEGKVEVRVRGRNAGEFWIEGLGDCIVVSAPEGGGHRWGSHEVTVRMPEGAELSVNTASADVDVEVEVQTLSANTASGGIRAGRVRGDVGANTSSGDIRFESVGGDFGANTASGNIHAGEVGGDFGANTASGDVHAGEITGDAGIKTASGGARVSFAHSDLGVQSASGDIEIDSYLGDSLECNTQSGDVRVSVPAGRTLNVDLDTLSGDISSELSEELESGESNEDGEDETAKPARLLARTVSGDITLARVR